MIQNSDEEGGSRNGAKMQRALSARATQGSLSLDGEGHLGVRWLSEERATTPPSEGRKACIFAPAIPSKGGVALTLPAALQGAARIASSLTQLAVVTWRRGVTPFAAFIFIAMTCGVMAQEDVDSARVNEAFKRAAQFLITCQDPATGAIHNRLRNETTMTSLAILSYAAMGHQPADPTPEGRSMKRALDFVLLPENQDATGYFGKADGSRMYGHGIITLALAEMLGMGTSEAQDALIRDRCRKAVDLILRAQRVPKNDANRGGWRYTPDASDSDMSITCWQTMALRSARNAGLDVPKESIDLAVRYIKSLYDSGNNGRGFGGFGYSSRGSEPSTTAEGLLALQVCGDYGCEEVKVSSDRLLKSGLKVGDRWFFYTAYYYAQGMYQRGDKHAAAARKQMADLLIPIQSREGWWDGVGGEERQGGKVYATALAVLALSVKNHFLPIYQR